MNQTTNLDLPAWGPGLLFCMSVFAAGCNSIDRFATRGDAAYCGDMVAAPRFHEGLLPRGVRPPTLSLRLRLEPALLASRPEHSVIVGRITSDDPERGLCADVGHPLFEEAALRTIPELDHDPLSLLEFGDGRDYNFVAWIDSTCQGTLLAVVSLMRNDSIEVRLLKPAALAAADVETAKRPGFGLFHLHRNEAGCAF